MVSVPLYEPKQYFSRGLGLWDVYKVSSLGGSDTNSGYVCLSCEALSPEVFVEQHQVPRYSRTSLQSFREEKGEVRPKRATNYTVMKLRQGSPTRRRILRTLLQSTLPNLTPPPPDPRILDGEVSTLQWEMGAPSKRQLQMDTMRAVEE